MYYRLNLLVKQLVKGELALARQQHCFVCKCGSKRNPQVSFALIQIPSDLSLLSHLLKMLYLHQNLQEVERM